MSTRISVAEMRVYYDFLVLFCLDKGNGNGAVFGEDFALIMAS